MGYYMRFILDDERHVSLDLFESALKAVDRAYAIERDEKDDIEGVLTYDGDVYGKIEINHPGDGLFDEEIEELIDKVNIAAGERKSKVLKVLSGAGNIIAVQVLFGERASEDTIDKISPLWEWLLANRGGLLQADDEGYYDREGLILEVK